MTATLDPLELYRWAVQDPETHATVLRVMYERTRPGRRARVLREDFAGTSAESVAWLALEPSRRAIAVDLDGPTLAWARRRAERLLGSRASSLELVCDDVMRVGPEQVPPADILSVLNFSILYLRERQALEAYLAHARGCLEDTGILVLNTFGGAAAVATGTTTHRVEPVARLRGEVPPPPFDYDWEVRSYDPASHAIDCAIHFRLDDGLQLRDAFRYAWRLWSPGELVDACRRAGFASVQPWRHTYDASKGAAGLFLGPIDPHSVDALPTWTAYVVAAR